jgi:hypothetical protein
LNSDIKKGFEIMNEKVKEIAEQNEEAKAKICFTIILE